MSTLDPRATAVTRARYDRIAPVYDLMQRGMEGRFVPWREALWHRVRGPRVLEVGLGTGQNMVYYPRGVSITAIDLSPRMLERARERARRIGVEVELREADAQKLPFPDASFDTVVATCVFCSVPDPLRGLQEIRRVLVPGGHLLLLEHVLSRDPMAARLMNLLNPLVVRMMGANINRRTLETVRQAGFANLHVENLWLDIFTHIEGYAPAEEIEERGRYTQAELVPIPIGASEPSAHLLTEGSREWHAIGKVAEPSRVGLNVQARMTRDGQTELAVGGTPSHQSYPSEIVALHDGTRVLIRAIRPDDAPRLQALLSRLSPQTVYFRVLAPLSVLPDTYARFLVKVDYHHRMALVATREPQGSDDIIGVARYAVTESNEEEAELAIVVEDAYQNRGLGTFLLARLAAYARAHGITTFLATILSENTRVLHLIERSGLPATLRSGSRGEVEVSIPLARGRSDQ